MTELKTSLQMVRIQLCRGIDICRDTERNENEEWLQAERLGKMYMEKKIPCVQAERAIINSDIQKAAGEASEGCVKPVA